MNDIEEALAAARQDSDLARAKQYTPEMVQQLRQAWIEERVLHYIDGGAKTAQARIHAEMQLNSWEMHKLLEAALSGVTDLMRGTPSEPQASGS